MRAAKVRFCGRGEERLIGALIPAPSGHRVPPVPAPLPALPVGLPAGVGGDGVVVETARVDRSGRVAAAGPLRVLGWRPGQRIDVAVVSEAIVVTAAVAGPYRIDGRNQVSLPAAARRMCGIAVSGPPVFVVAWPVPGLLVVHAAAMVAQLLAQRYAGVRAGV